MYRELKLAVVVATFLVLPFGCADAADAAEPFFHKKYGWQAEKFFDDPQVVALCKAIEANDLEEIDRLVAAGADANALGKGNMTPLLWAFPENHPERFKRILEHGADPNVLFESDFNTRMSGILPGYSVTHMVCDCFFPKYFDYVFEHGGNPNLVYLETQETPIFSLLCSMLTMKKKEKINRLIELGADLEVNTNNEWTAYVTPVDVAKSCFGQYDLALLLLEAGADYKQQLRPDHGARLIHGVVGAKRRIPMMSKKQKEDYQKLINWLEAHGESIQEATADKGKWRKWREAGTLEVNMAREVAERKARQAREAKKEWEVAAKPAFHEKYDWQAEKFFDDPQVIALCKAIEANDLKEIDRLVAAGADANARGKGNMTPLLWAYPENHPERFKRILEHGADPNILFKSDFNTRMSIVQPGYSVTRMVCDCFFPKYFDYVFEHGGDPNLVHPKYQETPIYTLLMGVCTNKKEKIERLIELGADQNANKENKSNRYTIPVKETAIAYAQYDIALMLFEAEADKSDSKFNGNGLLIHILSGAERRFPLMLSKKQKRDYHQLVKWLEAHGESVEAAKRWGAWIDQGAHQENMPEEAAQ